MNAQIVTATHDRIVHDHSKLDHTNTRICRSL